MTGFLGGSEGARVGENLTTFAKFKDPHLGMGEHLLTWPILDTLQKKLSWLVDHRIDTILKN